MLNQRKSLNELRHELNLSRDRHIFVEGYSDKHFFESWLDIRDALSGVSINVVGTIDVDSQMLDSFGLAYGERGRVIALAGSFEAYSDRLLCIADQDMGEGVGKFTYDTLVWTDFPALESYIMHPKLFRIAHKACMHGRLQSYESLYRDLSAALLSLWGVRRGRPHLPSPNYRKGMKKGGSLKEFDVHLAAGVASKGDLEADSIDAPGDVRKVAYGHDIAGLLFAADIGVMKNKLHYSDPDALERSMLASIIGTEELAQEPLFSRLLDWLGVGSAT